MGGNTLKKIETLATLPDIDKARKTGRYTVPQLSAEALAAYRERIEKTGSEADIARLNTAVRSGQVRNLLRLH